MEADRGVAADGGDAPPDEYAAAAAHVAACKRAADAGAPAPAPPFARGSEAFWWHALLAAVKAHDGVYSGASQLISPRGANLIRTPREEAELRGLVRAEDWLSADAAAVTAPGVGVRLHSLSGYGNGRLGRVLPVTGPGAPPEAVSPGRIAVRLAGASARVLSVKPANLAPAVVLAQPKKVAKPRPPAPWGPVSFAARLKACARFLDAPLPPEAPAGVYSLGFCRLETREDLQGAQLECHFLSAASDMPEDDARRMIERVHEVGDPLNAFVLQQLAASGVHLARDEFLIIRGGLCNYMTPRALELAGVAKATGRTVALPGEPPAPVLRCLLPPPPPPPGPEFPSGGSIAEAIARMFPQGPTPSFLTVTVRNNPAMPCAFELNWPADAEWNMQVEPPTRAFDPPDIQRVHWSSPAAAKAAEVALTALLVSPQQTTRYSDEALAVCEHCGDAWNARAMKLSTSWDQALDMYRRAVAAATAALAPELLEELAEMRGLTCSEREAQNMRTLWLVHPVRPLVRAMVGLANTLRRLQRWAEAAEAYRALHAMDPESHFGNSFWINWKTHVPETLMAAGCAAEARAYICHPDNLKCLSWTSSCISWLAAAAVLDAAQFRDTPADVGNWPGEQFLHGMYRGARTDSFQLAEAVARGTGQQFNPGGTMVSFAAHYSLALAWMLGLSEAPPLPRLSQIGPIIEGDSKTRAAFAAFALQGSKEALEAAVPGVLRVLRRTLCTVALHGWLSGEPIATITAEASLPEPDAVSAAAWIASGDVYANARFGNCTLLTHACRSTATSGVELTRALLAAGADTCDKFGTQGNGLAPIIQWAFYAGPLATGKVLLQPRTCKTCDQSRPLAAMLRHATHLLDAAFTAANQCNGAQLAALLAGMQEAMREGEADLPAIHTELLRNVLAGTVPLCLDTMGAEPCQRCMSRDKPHAPSASFARTMGVLVAAGALDPASSTSMAQARRIAAAGNSRLMRRWEAEHGAALRRRDASACALCGSTSGSTKRCRRCKAVRFCGAECAAAAWPTHKAACIAAAKTA